MYVAVTYGVVTYPVRGLKERIRVLYYTAVFVYSQCVAGSPPNTFLCPLSNYPLSITALKMQLTPTLKLRNRFGFFSKGKLHNCRLLDSI